MMSRPAIRPTRGAEGFTLIELLVVVLIIGILAAIAIPVLLSQKGKAYDALAKEMARSGEETAETYSTDHTGEYPNLTPAILREYEPAIQTSEGHSNAYISVAEAKESDKGYVITAVAPGPGHDTFTITRRENGEVLRTCKAEGSNKGGCETGSW